MFSLYTIKNFFNFNLFQPLTQGVRMIGEKLSRNLSCLRIRREVVEGGTFNDRLTTGFPHGFYGQTGTFIPG